jgi:hypothetical protein
MDPITASALIGVGGSLLQGITGGVNTRANRRWQERMWHNQNAYNHPKAQMARFKEAGLNPNLIYGQGSSGNAGSVGQVPTTPTTDPLQHLGQYMSLKLADAQKSNVEKQTEAIDSEIAQREADTALKRMQTLKVEKERLLVQQQTAKTRLERTKLAKDIGLLDKQIKQAEIDYQFSYASFGSRLKGIDYQNKYTKSLTEGQRIQNDVARTNRNAIVAKAYSEAKQAQLSLRGQALQNEMLRIQKELWQQGINPNSTNILDVFGRGIDWVTNPRKYKNRK